MNAIQRVYRPAPSRRPRALQWAAWCVLGVGLLLVLRWAVWDAVFLASGASVCRAIEGACWAVVTANWKLVLFGTYPVSAIWRPAAACLILATAFVLPCIRPSLAGLVTCWILGVGLAVSLLDGRLFGLAHVETREWGGLPLTLLLSEAIMLLAFPIALVTALARQSGNAMLSSLVATLVECIRGVPLVSLLFFAIQVTPLFLPGLSSIDKLSAAAAAITLFNAAYISEVIRGGLQAIPPGQRDAGQALGLRPFGLHRLVVLPQALSACAPSLVNHMVGIVKDTTFVVVVGLFDFMNTAQLTLAGVEWQRSFLEVYVFVGLVYFGLCTSVAWLGRRLSSGLAPARAA